MSGSFVSRYVAISLITGAVFLPAAHGADARPNADEECVMKCDIGADKCMEKAGADEDKAKACDDRYTECLNKCK